MPPKKTCQKLFQPSVKTPLIYSNELFSVDTAK